MKNIGYLVIYTVLISASAHAQTMRSQFLTKAEEAVSQKNYQSAADWYAIGAALDDTVAKRKIASLLYEEKIEHVSYQKAKEWFTLADERGDIAATFTLATLYLEGYRDIPQDYVLAKKLFDKAAANGNIASLIYIGDVFFKEGYLGIVPRDNLQRVKVLEDAKNKGNDEAYLSLAGIYSQTNLPFYDPAKAVAILQDGIRLHKKGCASGLFDLYEDEQWHPKDRHLPFQLLDSASKYGDTQAEITLTGFYLEHIRTKAEHEKGLAMLKKFVSSGDRKALYTLAGIYLEGELLPRDETKGINYLEKALELGSFDAAIKLNKIYQNGLYDQNVNEHRAKKVIDIIIPQLSSNTLVTKGYTLSKREDIANRNFNIAFQLYTASASMNNPVAFYDLGNIYCDGVGSARNFSTAIRYYEKGIALNDPHCMYGLAVMYSHGEGFTAPDQKKAVTLYERAASMGDINAIWNLADLYFRGTHGYQKNIEKAKKLWEQGAAFGDVNCLYNLAVVLVSKDSPLYDRERGLPLLKSACRCQVDQACDILKKIEEGKE